MTQPNFLQVQTSLARASAFVASHPDLSSSARYGELLTGVDARFERSTRITDASYTRWRDALAQERSLYRDIKIALDEIAALADEHAYDDLPRWRIIYTDIEQLRPLTEATMHWLSARKEEWSWMGTRADQLSRLLAEGERRQTVALHLYQEYTVEVKRRISAYEDAVAILREYYGDAHAEAARFEGFTDIRVDAV